MATANKMINYMLVCPICPSFVGAYTKMWKHVQELHSTATTEIGELSVLSIQGKRNKPLFNKWLYKPKIPVSPVVDEVIYFKIRNND